MDFRLNANNVELDNKKNLSNRLLSFCNKMRRYRFYYVLHSCCSFTHILTLRDERLKWNGMYLLRIVM